MGKVRKGNFILAIVVFLCLAAIFTGVCFLPYTDLEPNDTGRDMTKSTTLFKTQDETNITNFLKSEDSNADAVVITDSKGWIYKRGGVNDPVDIGSCKNAIVSALYGIAVNKGLIDLNKTLAEIEFDDTVQPLTETEKQAKIIDLLQGRSGIYLYAVGDEEVDLTKPARGEYAPGEHYYYQNWDINALGRIFEKLVQKVVISDVSLIEACSLGHCCLISGYKAVNNDYLVSAFEKLNCCVRTDVSGSAQDKKSHSLSPLMIKFLLRFRQPV